MSDTNPSHDKGNITDAEIAGYMGWRGPGAYTEASMRKIREIIDHVLRVERATPPSPSTAPEVDERAAFEAWARDTQQGFASLKGAAPGDRGWYYFDQEVNDAWHGWKARAALASRPAEVDDEGLPPLPEGTPIMHIADETGSGSKAYTAEQFRQGQRDAVAAYKQKQKQAALQELADQAQENGMGYGAAPSRITNKENGGTK